MMKKYLWFIVILLGIILVCVPIFFDCKTDAPVIFVWGITLFLTGVIGEGIRRFW